ncbi:MAG: TldD/PmbA family protein [Bacilli bacterium]|nr:TldD/PmbA family protein [Bacilli bacterium]MBN2696092.1 TldD/PmbA family protein [Bacilli bacterium]
MLTKELIEKILDTGMNTGADFAEVFVEEKQSSSLQMVSGRIEKATSSGITGVGIRLALKLQSVYGYTNDLNPNSLIRLAENLAKSFSGDNTARKPLMELEVGSRHQVRIDPREVKQAEKVELMKKAHKAADDYDELIKQVVISLGDSVQEVLIANSEGRFVTEKRVRVRMYINAIAEKDEVMQTGGEGPGTGKGYEYFYEDIDIEAIAKDAARTAKTMLLAEEAPSGIMPVIINNKFGGVIFHEACGHSLEATSVAKNASVFCGKLNTQVANPIVTAIDDGTIENGWGSANFDDEGYPQQRRVLIDKGILKSYMVDQLNSRRMDHKPTGSSRRESYKYAPTSRMSNTYIDNGESTFDEIIAATEYGLYAAKMGGGSVNPGTGDFNFAVSEGYIIRNGKIAEPVRGASLVGNGAEILHKIDMVGNNLDRARGMCGSVSGSIPADVGQPTLRVASITVGGKKGAN